MSFFLRKCFGHLDSEALPWLEPRRHCDLDGPSVQHHLNELSAASIGRDLYLNILHAVWTLYRSFRAFFTTAVTFAGFLRPLFFGTKHFSQQSQLQGLQVNV